MRNTRIGIIGGGQLGMMLVQAAVPFPCQISVYDPNPTCSAAGFTSDFTQGEFSDFDAILEFGQKCDAVIFEIERVNADALIALQKKGVKVVSSPEVLKWIQNKSIQRQTLDQEGFPVMKYQEITGENVRKYNGEFPVVQKLSVGGYDGKGVIIHQDTASLESAPEVDSVFEEMVDIEKELSVIVARNEHGDITCYEPTEMVFDPDLNLLDYLIAPANISEEIVRKLREITNKFVTHFEFVGICAIEFFLTKTGEILINEISPRVHNSGHQTVLVNVCSQYEQQIRIALGLPLGSEDQLDSCLLANLIADNSQGDTAYIGLEEGYKIPGTQFTFYGKEQVKPGRKMGHVVILGTDMEEKLSKLDTIRKNITITSHAS